MQLFSEDYLMHWGVKGMKWKKHRKDRFFTDDPEKRKEFETAEQYLQEGYYNAKKDPLYNGMDESSKRRLAYKHANELHRSDISVSKNNAYKRNQKRIARQQRKAKVNNALKKVKNKVFTDTSGMKKVGSHTYVKFEEPVITSTSGSRGKKRR